jgi:hypothetical protein
VVATTSVTLKRPGKLLVLGSGHMTDLEQYEVGANGAPLRLWRIVSAPAGRQTIRLVAEAAGASSNDESVKVYNAQIAVVALPTLG